MANIKSVSLITYSANPSLTSSDNLVLTNKGYVDGLWGLTNWASGTYAKDALVVHGGKIYKSNNASNTTTPGATGSQWTQVTLKNVFDSMGSTYTAGTGIDITNNSISIDVNAAKTALNLGTAAEKAVAANTGTESDSGKVPVLDGGGKLSVNVMPARVIGGEYLGEVANETAMIGKTTATVGDFVKRTDKGTYWMLGVDGDSAYSNKNNWFEYAGAVTKVNDNIGNVTQAQLGLVTAFGTNNANVDDTKFPSFKLVDDTYARKFTTATWTSSGTGASDWDDTGTAVITQTYLASALGDFQGDLGLGAAASYSVASDIASGGTGLVTAGLVYSYVTNYSVPIGKLPTTSSVSDDSSKIPTAAAVFSALSNKVTSSDVNTAISSATISATQLTGTLDPGLLPGKKVVIGGTSSSNGKSYCQIPHGFDTSALIVQVYDNSGNLVLVDTKIDDTNVTLSFATNLTSAASSKYNVYIYPIGTGTISSGIKYSTNGSSWTA